MDTNIRASRRSLIGALAALSAGAVPVAALSVTTAVASPAWDEALSAAQTAWDDMGAFHEGVVAKFSAASSPGYDEAEDRYNSLVDVHHEKYRALLATPAPSLAALLTTLRLSVDWGMQPEQEDMPHIVAELERLTATSN